MTHEENFEDTTLERKGVSSSEKDEDAPVHESHNLSRKEGDGARDRTEDWRERMSRPEDDGRSMARTTFYPSDAPGETEDDYRRLYLINEGVRVNDDNRSHRNNLARREKDALLYASQLGFSNYQKERVLYMVRQFDFDGLKTEKVLLAMISLVANEDEHWVQGEPLFNRLMQTVQMDGEELRKMRSKVQRAESLR